ncbi:MAG TPA: TIR domain-containing protein, partial [Ilumatobacteraceae bacterium]|nr:TIR domain-containing protein [Ilumatobacteraceae bacterium]
MGRTSEPGIAGDGADHRLRIFISYRRQETAPYAGRLYDELAERFGESQVFMDVDTIQAGADFEQEIVATIARANVVLAVVGPRWLTVSDHDGRRRLDDPDDFVRRELDAALQGDARVIPLLVQDAEMPAAEDLPEPLRAFGRRQAFILSDRRWRADVGELIGVLDDLAAGSARHARRDGSTGRPGTPTGATARRPAPLPHHRTSFVGREDDVERIDQLLATSGFVTIVGPGGVGKSRLAVEVARRVEDRYDDGVGLVDLTAIDDPSLIVPAIMRATAAGTGERDSSLDALVAQLTDRCLLLLLDNCEHVIGDAAIVAEGLVLRCPALHVLATSREALLVDCEAVWPLDPLATPDVDATTGSGALAESAAVRLFVDRAVLSSPRFTLDDATAPTVARLVAALDGLPLAIELAASSLRSVPLEAVMTGLSDQFASVAARRTSHTRQRTLWATVDWSYQLLDAAEQLLLERVGVFASSFTAEVAATVCGVGLPDGSVGPTMLRLVDRSLVSVVDADGSGTRYRLLYSVRDFARSQLATRADDPTPGRLQAWAVDVATTHG